MMGSNFSMLGVYYVKEKKATAPEGAQVEICGARENET